MRKIAGCEKIDIFNNQTSEIGELLIAREAPGVCKIGIILYVFAGYKSRKAEKLNLKTK